MDVRIAAQNTLTVLSKSDKLESGTLPMPVRTDDGIELCHQIWLLDQVKTGKVTGEKAHRWLSWAQGVLAACGLITLTDAKYCNLLS